MYRNYRKLDLATIDLCIDVLNDLGRDVEEESLVVLVVVMK